MIDGENGSSGSKKMMENVRFLGDHASGAWANSPKRSSEQRPCTKRVIGKKKFGQTRQKSSRLKTNLVDFCEILEGKKLYGDDFDEII